MKSFNGLLFLLSFGFVAAVSITENSSVFRVKQRRWLADDLKAHHQKMRQIHKDYVPAYPDAPLAATIHVGTPPAEFTVSVESGSEAMFLLAKDYPGLDTPNQQPFYDPSQSSTAANVGDFEGFSGVLNATGAAYTDVVRFFELEQGVKTTQRFGVINLVSSSREDNPEMLDGVLGLSWNPADAAHPNKNSSAILSIFQVLNITDRYWCEWLDASTSGQTREVENYLLFGECGDAYGLCKAATSENTYPLVWLEDSRSLAFTVDSFTYNGQQFDGGYGKLDTGVPLVLLAYTAFLAIFDDLQPNYDLDHGIYTVDCTKANSLPDWTFTIGGDQYTLPSSAYVVDLLLPHGQCALSVHYSDVETTDYVLGYVFHKLWCVKMDVDNQAISFMKSLPPPPAEPASN